jgi:hypothetical protein
MAMRWLGLGLVLGTVGAAVAQDRPLPDVATLRARALATHDQANALREHYLCRARVTEQEVDKNGAVKKTTVDEREMFYVKGREISQTVLRDGKPLSPGEEKKEVEAAKKHIEEAEKGKTDTYGISQTDVLRLMVFSNERRGVLNGRPVILFDLKADPKAKADGVVQKMVQAVEGTVAVDETSGHVVETDVHGVRDVKIAGGLVANVHKGFRLHVRNAPREDGVWMVAHAEGSGDARVGLFLHPAMRFQQELEGCKLFNVSESSVEKIEAAH